MENIKNFNCIERSKITRFFLVLLILFSVNNIFTQEIIDSFKIDTKYQEYRYLYSNSKLRTYTHIDSSITILDTFIRLKINNIKRYYIVSDIYSFINYDSIEYNLIEITDYSNKWAWTIISEKDSCMFCEKLKINGMYYLEIHYFDGEEGALRLPFDSSSIINLDGNTIIVDSRTKKTYMVYSPNIKGLCFIPTD